MKNPKKKIAGRPRTVSDAEVRLLRQWITFNQLCREIGISANHGRRIRKGYKHKQHHERNNKGSGK